MSDTLVTFNLAEIQDVNWSKTDSQTAHGCYKDVLSHGVLFTEGKRD